jgi:hypothetical protein
VPRQVAEARGAFTVFCNWEDPACRLEVLPPSDQLQRELVDNYRMPLQHARQLSSRVDGERTARLIAEDERDHLRSERDALEHQLRHIKKLLEVALEATVV